MFNAQITFAGIHFANTLYTTDDTNISALLAAKGLTYKVLQKRVQWPEVIISGDENAVKEMLTELGYDEFSYTVI